MIVNTIVFLEVSTTGLPSDEWNQTKLTEITLMAVRRQHFLFSNPASPPRVLNKFTFCVNPQQPITIKAERYTGLNNYMLENEAIFDEEFFDMILTFMEMQPKPVTFVSHFGKSLDYPVLQNHIKKLNKSLPADILYVDTYDLFRTIFPNLKSYKLSEIYKKITLSTPGDLHTSAIDCRLLMLSGLTIKRSFIEYIDANCRPFAEIAPMEVGTSFFSDERRYLK